MEPQILVNRIITPDGTELISRHRHDYVTYTDKNGQHYSVDGGDVYLRRGFDVEDYTEASLTSADPFELLRQHIYRGGRGKDGKQPLTYVALKDMNNPWLVACIEYEEEHRPSNIYLPYYKMELEYRGEHNIYIEEQDERL